MKTVTLLQPTAHELTPELVQDVVSLVDETPPSRDELQQWTEIELLLVYDWAMREHMRASDNRNVRRRPKPWLLGRLQESGFKHLTIPVEYDPNDALRRENAELRARVAALESGQLIPPDVEDTWHYKAARQLIAQYDACRSMLEVGTVGDEPMSYQAGLVQVFAETVANVKREEERGRIH